MKTVLHVGCGLKRLEALGPGYQGGDWRELRFDISETVDPDIVGDILDMKDIDEGSVDSLWSSHNIEHVFAHQVHTVLTEFRRVLAPDGFAVITCPDLQSLGERIAEGRLDDPVYTSPSGPITPLDILYGHGASIEKGGTYMAHKTGFSLRSLARAMDRAGFTNLVGTRRRSRTDLWIVGFKDEGPREDRWDIFKAFTGVEVQHAAT